VVHIINSRPGTADTGFSTDSKHVDAEHATFANNHLQVTYETDGEGIAPDILVLDDDGSFGARTERGNSAIAPQARELFEGQVSDPTAAAIGSGISTDKSRDHAAKQSSAEAGSASSAIGGGHAMGSPPENVSRDAVHHASSGRDSTTINAHGPDPSVDISEDDNVDEELLGVVDFMLTTTDLFLSPWFASRQTKDGAGAISHRATHSRKASISNQSVTIRLDLDATRFVEPLCCTSVFTICD